MIYDDAGNFKNGRAEVMLDFAAAVLVLTQLEAAGIVSAQDKSKNREVLVSTFEELDRILAAYKNN